MRGRPKKENSRETQYRVRLNDEEDSMLNYLCEMTGRQKADIFRNAVKEYYNKVSIREAMYADEDEYEDWGIDHISLKRRINCPICGSANLLDFEDECDISYEERQMGEEITYQFDWESVECRYCKSYMHIYGAIYEYPVGAYNYEEIHVESED